MEVALLSDSKPAVSPPVGVRPTRYRPPWTSRDLLITKSVPSKRDVDLHRNVG